MNNLCYYQLECLSLNNCINWPTSMQNLCEWIRQHYIDIGSDWMFSERSSLHTMQQIEIVCFRLNVQGAKSMSLLIASYLYSIGCDTTIICIIIMLLLFNMHHVIRNWSEEKFNINIINITSNIIMRVKLFVHPIYIEFNEFKRCLRDFSQHSNIEPFNDW